MISGFAPTPQALRALQGAVGGLPAAGAPGGRRRGGGGGGGGRGGGRPGGAARSQGGAPTIRGQVPGAGAGGVRARATPLTPAVERERSSDLTEANLQAAGSVSPAAAIWRAL